MVRLFVAIDVGDYVADRIKAIQNDFRRLKLDVRFMEPRNLHITLKFLGDVSDRDVPEVKKRAARVLEKFLKFHLTLEDFGYFGPPSHIRVLWFGVKEKDILVNIMSELNRELDFINKDERKPSPHITLGRISSINDKETLLREIERLKNVKLGEMDVKQIKLKKSELARDGPIYSDYAVFYLKEKP